MKALILYRSHYGNTKQVAETLAAGILQETAKDLGLSVLPNALRCEVKGLKGPLADGEQDKAAAFVKDLISGLSR